MLARDIIARFGNLPENNCAFYEFMIQLFQKTLSKEKQKAHKPRLQGNMGIFETSLQCRHHIAKIFPVALDMDERSVRV